MSVKPILFNTDMVRAILDGRKTVTRRVVKPQPVCYRPNITFTPHSNDFFISAEKGWLRCRDCGNDPEYSQEWSSISHHWIPPYQLNDIIYVRETQSIHRVNNMCDKYIRVNYKADGVSQDFRVSEKEWKRLAKYDYTDECYISPYWTTYETCRIWLKVTNVRVERLQDITWQQAAAEGCQGLTSDKPDELFHLPTLKGEFETLWNSTVNKADVDHYGWEGNPWVWVIEFERCEKPQEVEQ